MIEGPKGQTEVRPAPLRQQVFFALVDGGKVLVEHRNWANTWLILGGAVEDGESPREAAIREAKEELGVDVLVLEQLEHDPVVTRSGREVVTFVVTNWRGEIPFANLDDGSELLWIEPWVLLQSPIESQRVISGGLLGVENASFAYRQGA